MQIEKNTKQIGIYLYFQDTAYLRTWFKVSISLNHPNLMLSVYGLMVFIRLINHVKRLVMESGSQHETLTHTVDTDAQRLCHHNLHSHGHSRSKSDFVLAVIVIISQT